LNNLQLIYPMAAMVLLTVIVLTRMVLGRFSSVKAGEVDARFYKTYQGDDEPRAAAQNTRHVTNLFENPVLFYAACLAAIATDQGTAAMVWLAWAFVACRVIHAIVQCRKLIVTNNWRKRLLALRAELEGIEESGAEASAVVELDQTKVGRLSRMDAMQAQAMAQASQQRRAQMLRRIDAALRRIEEDEYGDCRACDEPINPKRLEFDPTADLCIACASKAERN
jgi:DnaK suppressor protein